MRVLVGDDQSDVLEAARLVLKGGGHMTVTASTPAAVLHEARKQPFDVLLLDLNYARDTTSGGEGLDLLNGLRASGVHAPVVVMTAWASVDLAVEAMRRGAIDFVQKPWDNDRLLATIGRYGTCTESETHRARRIQQTLLGRADITIPGLDYAGVSLPVGDLGGDSYDFIDLGKGRLAIGLADVSGKGVGSALLMAHLQSALRSRADLADDPLQMVEAVNLLFWKSSPAEQYATLFYCVYDSCSRRMQFVNAGHTPAVLLRGDGTAESLESSGMPVGMFASWHGQTESLRMNPGDRLALISDGVVEAGCRAEHDFAEAGVVEALRRSVRRTAQETAQYILSEAGKRGAEDDMTAVVLSVA